VLGGTGTCSGLPTNGQPVYVIGTSPHMHRLGSGFTTTVDKNGHLLSNIPMEKWVFDQQIHYGIDRYQLLPGDRLTTRCYYTNPAGSAVRFGPRTQDEMCYDFMMVYPSSGTKKECGQGITFGGS